MKKSSFKMKLICSIVVVNTSCAFPVKDLTPEVVDISKGHARIYRVKMVEPVQCGDPDYEVFHIDGEEIPIDQMAGHVCFPTAQMQEMQRYYNEYLRRKADCQNIQNQQGTKR